MQKTLMNLGFSEKDTQVYLFLAAEGPKKARDMAEALNLCTSQLYRVLKKLQINGVIIASSEYPTRFSAVLFNQVLDLLAKTKKEQIKALKASKEELLSSWRLLTEKDDEKS
jgi:sugar-specific transcriptional regulator TrmB